MNKNEFSKKFRTLSSKINLCFAYRSASEKSLEDLEINPFAYTRNYVDFLYLDMQSFVLSLFDNPDSEYWVELEKKIMVVDDYYNQLMKKFDKQHI